MPTNINRCSPGHVAAAAVLIMCLNLHANANQKCLMLNDVLRYAETTCIVAIGLTTDWCKSGPDMHSKPETVDSSTLQVFMSLKQILTSKHKEVFIGYVDIGSLWPSGDSLKVDDGAVNSGNIFIFSKMVKDRTCLLTKQYPLRLTPIIYNGHINIPSLIEKINQACNTYYTDTGTKSVEGIHRDEILNTKFYVRNISDVQSKQIFTTKQHTCKANDGHCSDKRHSSKDSLYKDKIKIPECEKIELPTKGDFFHNYVKISKPVIFKKVLNSWPAYSKWSNNYLREKYGKNNIHVKLTSLGEYEGVEQRNLWKNHDSIKIPDKVSRQLQFSDLVVVRPATQNMNFSNFIDVIEKISNGTIKDRSAYLEYSSIPQYLPELEDDIREDILFDGLLKRDKLNIWLSDGKTLGKLHFDPYDNLLCQISGKKQVILFDPHTNDQLYEGHIPEALLSYNETLGTFSRKDLLESTSMVMSPVDILDPDYKRFPKFGETYPMNCTIEEGDILYMPSFWWHEVQSYPSISAKRNLAINFWYEPFLTREFPCPECQLDVNPVYRHLL